jgi:hypothetical protein
MISNQMNNQNNFLTRTRQLIRRCSFCRSTEHIVTNCNDERLQNFRALLIVRRDELREIPSIDINNKIMYFETWLYGQDNNLIKSCAMKFCGAYARNNLQTCVEKIISLIWGVEPDILGNVVPIHDSNYIQLPAISIMDIPDPFEFIDLTEFIAGLRNDRQEPIENRKYNITGILCNEIESEERTTQQILEELDTIENCNICYEDKQNRHMVSLNCRHNFCGNCMSSILKKCNPLNLPTCAMCRAKIGFLIVKDEKILNTLKENLV